VLGPGTHALPAPVDGTRNITRQSNAQPGVFDGLTGTVSFKRQLDDGWVWHTQYGTQRLRADDRLIYASGCATGAMDRFCTNGDFQIHDYRSENERRNTEAMQTDLRGQVWLGGLEHSVKLSLMRQRQINQMPYAYTDNLVGTTNVNGGLISTPSYYNASLTDSSDYSTEIGLNDRLRLTERTTAWLGLRHTQLNRQSAQTDGSAAKQEARGVSTPWVALSHQPTHSYTMYASYGQGLETEVVPNLSNPNTMLSYTNAGQPLPALKSTQREIGIKTQFAQTAWQVTWFDITRPATADAPVVCNNIPPACIYTRKIDGQNHHQGLEISTQTKLTRWDLDASAMRLDAKRENATVQTDLNGQHPINVPKYILRGMAQYQHPDITGLRSGLRISREGERNVTEHGEIVLPAWTTLDATTHYDTTINNVASSWTLALNNLANKHYWRESPKQYGQYFLYPGAPRTIRATVQFRL
jgi:iron complex outermembrane receptor protein